mmetsp:Transcript_8351/g.20836  ORF Transcript_8351/g.20836 Transcript_8351/m.20836 type:complete len:96 (-) Transcript_8351:231-518(-)
MPHAGKRRRDDLQFPVSTSQSSHLQVILLSKIHVLPTGGAFREQFTYQGVVTLTTILTAMKDKIAQIVTYVTTVDAFFALLVLDSNKDPLASIAV